MWMSLAHLFFDGPECRKLIGPFSIGIPTGLVVWWTISVCKRKKTQGSFASYQRRILSLSRKEKRSAIARRSRISGEPIRCTSIKSARNTSLCDRRACVWACDLLVGTYCAIPMQLG